MTSPICASQGATEGREWETTCAGASGESEGADDSRAVPASFPLCQSQELWAGMQCSPGTVQWPAARASSSLLGGILVESSIPAGWPVGAVWPPHTLMYHLWLQQSTHISSVACVTCLLSPCLTREQWQAGHSTDGQSQPALTKAEGLHLERFPCFVARWIQTWP